MKCVIVYMHGSLLTAPFSLRFRGKHRGVRRTVEDHIMGRMGLMGKHKAKKKDLSLEETPGKGKRALDYRCEMCGS